MKSLNSFTSFLTPENRRMNAATSYRCTVALSPILSRVHSNLRRALRICSWSVLRPTEKVCSSGPIWWEGVPFRPHVRMGHVSAKRMGTPRICRFLQCRLANATIARQMKPRLPFPSHPLKFVIQQLF